MIVHTAWDTSVQRYFYTDLFVTRQVVHTWLTKVIIFLLPFFQWLMPITSALRWISDSLLIN